MGRLILSREVGETVILIHKGERIGGITTYKDKTNRLKLMFDFSKETNIVRGECYGREEGSKDRVCNDGQDKAQTVS